MKKIEEIRKKSFDNLLHSIETTGYGATTSQLVTEKQLNFLKEKYIVASSPKTLGTIGKPFIVCKH